MASPLRGRSAELGLLLALVEDAARGIARVATVEGEPGIGKTALLDAAARRAAGLGFVVLRADADEVTSTRPLALLLDALVTAGASDAVSAVSAVLETARGSGTERRQAAIEAWLRELEDLASQAPLLLALDDLQWADEASLLALRGSLPRLLHLPVAIVFARRPRPRPDAVPALDERVDELGAPLTRIDLGPLEPDDVAALAADLIGTPPHPELLSVLARAGGNPLYVQELLHAPDPGAVDRFAVLIERRLRTHDDLTRRVVKVAAVLGRHVDAGLVAFLLGRPVATLLPTFDDLVADRLLASEGDRLVFTHDLVRDTIYDALPHPIRRALHVAAARAMASTGGDALVIAEHFRRGAEPGDVDAVRWLRHAASSSASTMPTVSTTLLRSAAVLTGNDARLRWSVLADLALLLSDVGKLDEAVRVGEELLDGRLSPEDEAKVRFGLARAVGMTGRFREAMRLAGSTDALPPDLRSRWVASTSSALAHTGRLDRAWEVAQEAKELGAAARQPGAVAIARHTEGIVLRYRGEHVAAAALLSDVAPRLGPEATPEHTLLVLESAYAALLVDDPGLAGARVDAARAACEERGWLGFLPPVLAGVCAHRFAVGRWDDVVTEAASLSALADDLGAAPAYPNPYLYRTLVHLARGEDDEARSVVDDALAVPGLAGGPVRWAEAAALEAAGQRDAAWHLAQAAWEDAQWNLAEVRLNAVRFVRLALSVGADTDARRAAEVAGALAARATTASTSALATWCGAVASGDVSSAAKGARQMAETGMWPLDSALALAHAARLALAVGDRASAADLTARATAILAPLRAEGLIADLSPAVGDARWSQRRRARPVTGWASLTPAEARVAVLVATGRSNRAIAQELGVSLRTVETHLTRTFAKLQVRSRVKLALVASQNGR